MKKCIVFVFILVFCVPLFSSWEVSQKIVASDRTSGDHYGYSLAISGDLAIVGAYDEDESADHQYTMTSAGSAYIYRFNGSVWEEEQKIVASDRATGDWFGMAVDICDDICVVGAKFSDLDEEGGNIQTSAGAAYIFRCTDSVWVEEQKLVPLDRSFGDFFGAAVSISGDAVVIGAYEEDEDADDNNTLASAGSAYIFRNSGSTWTQEQKIVPSDRREGDYFGRAVEIKGDTILVGAEEKDIYGVDTLLYSSAGTAYVFTFVGSTWLQADALLASDAKADERFGSSLAINDNTIFIGARTADTEVDGYNATNTGAVYVFEHNTRLWQQSDKIVSSDADANDFFGRSISVSDTTLLVGADGEEHDLNDEYRLDYPGSAYFYTKCDTGWGNEQKIISPDRAHYDSFGISVGISGDHALIGVMYDSEDENEANTLSYAGSAYFFSPAQDTVSIQAIPAKFELFAAYPNPFNPRVALSMEYGEGSYSVINIYNVQGKLVDRLVNAYMEAGRYELTWDASDMPSGVYIVRMTAGEFVASQKIVLMK